MRIHQKVTAAIAGVTLGCAFSAYAEDAQKITLIHIGDTHGQIEPTTNVRSDNTNKDLEGGLARMYTLVKKIRSTADEQGRTHYTFMVGDTAHGGLEVTFTRGDGIVEIQNEFDIDLFAPGNWEFTYGTCRANQLWGFTDEARGILDGNSRIKDTSNGSIPPFHNVNGSPAEDCDFSRAKLANWPTIASNAYIDNDRNSANCPSVADRTRLFEPYRVVTDPRTGINIGVIAFTTERGPRVIGNPVVEGICFTKGDEEIVELVDVMNQKREAGEVDMVVMISELNHANNRRLIDLVDEALGPGGVDLVLSSDMHERTRKIIYTKNGTAMVSQGQDGSHLGELNLTFKKKKLTKIDFKQYRVEEAVEEDTEIAEIVESVREPFLNGTSDARHFVHGRMLPKDPGDLSKHFPAEEPLAYAGIDLNRNNFTHETTAAIYEGTIHSMFTDALRATGKQLIEAKRLDGKLDVGQPYEALCASHVGDSCEVHLPVLGLIRGFRYATSVRAGEPITLETLYHIAPIGPFATVGVVTGEVLLGRGAANNQAPTANGLEHAAHLSLSTNVSQWGGGWLQAYAGMRYSLNPYADKDQRIPNEQVLIGNDAEGYTPIDAENGKYIIVGYGFNDVVFGTDSGANEYVFVNKPFKMNQAGIGNVWRIVFEDDTKSTLDFGGNPLDLVEVPFSTNGDNPPINSLPVVDLMARYLLENYGETQPFMLQEPVSRVNLLCHQPNMADVKNTKNSKVLDRDNPIVDIGFPMIQSIFGANKNMIPFLNDGRLQECVDNGIIDISRGRITYTGD